MPVFLITTDIKDSTEEHDLLEFELKVLSQDPQNIEHLELISNSKPSKYIKVKESVWLLKSNLDSDQIDFNLKESLPNFDNYLIIEVADDFQGKVPTSVYSWLETYLD